jgi:hypothetical protein
MAALTMRHIGLLTAALLSLAASSSALAASPPKPFIHRGACPFECCTYRDWTTTGKVTLVSKPQGKKQIATIAKGTVVRGVTGWVIADPVRMVAGSDVLESPIRKGEVFYVLHYAGEGYWTVWYRGKVIDAFFEKNMPARAAWWVQIRTRGGITGWTSQSDRFADQDACG